MASQEMGLIPPHRLDNGGMGSQLVYQDDRFTCAPPRRVGDPARTRELSGFLDDKMFASERGRFFSPPPPQGAAPDFRRSMFADRSGGGDGSNDDDDEDDDEDEDDEVDDEGDGEVEALIPVDDGNQDKNHNNDSSGSVHSCAAVKIGSVKPTHHSSFGSNREGLVKDGNFVQSVSNAGASTSADNQQGRVNSYQNAVTTADTNGELYYSQFLQGPEGSAGLGQKDLGVENGCGFSGRKEVAYSIESGESLRAILSDPITGSLMDDAMILPCGHSFGSSGMQQVLRVKACYTCSQPISEDSIQQNLSLRDAVLAFRREESQYYRASKRRRERFEQDKGNYGDSFFDPRRSRGVQFPFAVTDRVIIKGNKRTPQRFVGREAVVTTQCLNGWYVVKTMDNAESVKLQYRSLAKVPDDLSSKPTTSKTPNWL